MSMRSSTSSSQRSHSGNHHYDIRLNGSSSSNTQRSPVTYKSSDPTAKYTNKLDNLHHNYHQSSPQIPPHIKVVVMGGLGVGKTSLMDQFTEKHQPSEVYRPTKYPNENQYKCTYTLDARRVYNLEVLDTEGLEPDSQFPTRLLPQDMKQFAYLVVFSVSHYGSFKLAEELLKQLVISLEFDTETPIVLVGNKSDVPTKRDEGYTFYTTDRSQTHQYTMWDPEQERIHRKKVGSFYDPEIHDEYRQVKQEDAWKLASKFNIKYKEVTAQCYADIVNVFVEVVTQRDKICDHRRRMDLDADNREAGELTCDFMSTSPQKRRKYFETMKLEYEYRMKELQTRLNLGVIEKSEFNAFKDDLDFWMNDLKINFDRMNSMGYSMHPHIRELHMIEGRYVREPAPDRSHILNEVYPPSCPDTNIWAGRKSKDPSTSSETKVNESNSSTSKNLTSASLISKNAPAPKKNILQKTLSTSKNHHTKEPKEVSFESNSNNKTSTAAASSKTTSPNSSPSKNGNNSSSSSSKPVKKSKKSKNNSSSSRSSPNKNSSTNATTTSSSSSSRNRNSTSTSSRPSPNGTRRRRSDSQGSFRTLSGVLDMFKNLPERIIGKVS